MSIYTNLRNLALLIGATTALAIGVNYVKKYQERGLPEGYKAVFVRFKTTGQVLGIKENEAKSFLIWAEDRDYDGKFEKIDTSDLPKGHPLERIATPEGLERIAKETKVIE